jgi:hypothetical protein
LTRKLPSLAFRKVGRFRKRLESKATGPSWVEKKIDLGSGLIDHSQKMTAAAMQIAEK